MSDPTTPSLAPLESLSSDVTPPTISSGYGNPLLGIATEFFKLHAADNRQQANRELDRREELAQRFDRFSNDPRYSNHPALQRDAHMHAAAIRQIPYNKPLPPHFKPDKDGNIPAYGALFHRAALAEIRKNGEPSKPAEPPQPPPPPAPFGGDEQGQGWQGGTGDAQNAMSAGPPAPTSAIAPVPGGVQPVPGKISPAPAIPGAPTMSAAPPAPPVPSDSGEIYPMSPPEMAAFNNSIPASSAPELAAQLGVATDGVIDLRMLKGSSLIKGAADRAARMAIHGLDEDGNPLPVDKLSPEQLYKRAAADMAEAHTKLFAARAISDPIKAKAEVAHWQAMEGIARQNLGLATSRLGLSQQRLDLEKSLYGGLGTGTPSSGAGGGSGGPDDYMSDNHVSQTNSGRYYVDLTGYTGKVKNAMMERYTAQGLPVVDGPRAKAISDIDGARLNQDSVLASIFDKLPKDASGRITGGLGNKLSQFLQTDEELAAFNAWRTTAIRTLRATAGSEGLRLNEKEILLAVANDIPKITDTVGTAQQKQANIRAQLDNVETSMLVRRRGGLKGSQGKDDYSGAAINSGPPNPNTQPAQPAQPTAPRAGGNALPPASQRIVGQTTATINGTPMVWSKTSKGVGWQPIPQSAQ